MELWWAQTCSGEHTISEDGADIVGRNDGDEIELTCDLEYFDDLLSRFTAMAACTKKKKQQTGNESPLAIIENVLLSLPAFAV